MIEQDRGICAQIVPNSCAFLIIPAHSSARDRRNPPVPHQTVTCTYEDLGIGLKILVSAVQSRPCPPLLSNTCPLRNSLRNEFVPRFVPTSGTLWSVPTHVNQEPRAIQYPLEGRFVLAGSLRGAPDDSLGLMIGGSEKNRVVVRRSIR